MYICQVLDFVLFQVGVGSRKIKVRSLGKEQVSCQMPKEEIENSELKRMIKSKFLFEKEEGGSGASSDSEGEIFSSSSAAEGERGNIYLNAIEPKVYII